MSLSAHAGLSGAGRQVLTFLFFWTDQGISDLRDTLLEFVKVGIAFKKMFSGREA